MPSKKPVDFGTVLKPRAAVSPAERIVLSLGAFTANTTVTAPPMIVFDRAAVIREIHVACSAIPSDPDGTMLLNAIVYDVSEAADDTIVSSADLEATVLAALTGYKLTLATETSENELTVAAGDTLRFTLVNNSAAITTNPNTSVVVVVQYLTAVTG